MTRSVFTDSYGKLCKLLLQARKAARLRQTDLAAALKRPQSFVSKYERGERRLDVIEFLEVVDAIGCDPGQLLATLRSRPKKGRAAREDRAG